MAGRRREQPASAWWRADIPECARTGGGGAAPGAHLLASGLDGDRRVLDPDARARVNATKRAMRLEVALAELREARGMGQSGVADKLGTRIESEVDVRLSTLERYVEALGGRLKIHAVFDDEVIDLS